jgi:hypothetical protein
LKKAPARERFSRNLTPPTNQQSVLELVELAHEVLRREAGDGAELAREARRVGVSRVLGHRGDVTLAREDVPDRRTHAPDARELDR